MCMSAYGVMPLSPLSEVNLYVAFVVRIRAPVHFAENRGVRYLNVLRIFCNHVDSPSYT